MLRRTIISSCKTPEYISRSLDILSYLILIGCNLQEYQIIYHSRQEQNRSQLLLYYVCIQLVIHRYESPSINEYQLYNAASSELKITVGVFGLGNRVVQHLLSPNFFSVN